MKLSRSDSYYNSPSRTDDGTSRGLLCSSAGAVRASSKISRAIILSGILLIFLIAAVVTPVCAASVTVTANPNVGEVGTLITFTAEANGLGENETVTSWEWSGDDGITGSGDSITHTFNTDKSFTVTAKANIKDSNTDEVSTEKGSVTVTITKPTPQLKAEFTADKTSGDAPLTVKFTDKSTGATSWEWNFGDGNTSTAQNPEYTYKYSGTYPVTLKVDDGSSNPATSNPTTITVKAPTATPTVTTDTTTAPTTQPTATPTTGTSKANVTIKLTPGTSWSDYRKVAYQATASGSGIGTITYSWDFGDGSTAKGASGTHEYTDNKEYEVTLTATSDKSDITIAPVQQKVTIKEPTVTAKIKIDREAGTYKITYADDSGISKDYIKSWEWNFDADNASSKSTSDKQSGTFEYQKSGTYKVVLKITTVGGQTAEKSDTVKISGLTAAFTADPTSGGAPLEVKFTDKSKENSVTHAEIIEWKWDFGDGSKVVYDDHTPTHTFTKVGKYTVTLKVTDKDSNKQTSEDTATMVIVVDDGLYPTANFDVSSSSSRSGSAPLEVKFLDKSTVASSGKANITEWAWKITNSEGSTVKTYSTKTAADKDFTYKFTDGGKYTVSLTVTDKNGRSNTKTETDYITVSSGLSATFTASPTSGTAPLNVRFEATPDPDNAYDIDEYAWNFGDGSSVYYGRVISHVFSNAGTYTVKMTVTDEKSKTYTATRSNYITVTAASKTVAPTATPTVAAGSESDKTKSSKLSKGDRIFGIPGTQPIRSEMQRMYGFFDDFFTLFFGMFGSK